MALIIYILVACTIMILLFGDNDIEKKAIKKVDKRQLLIDEINSLIIKVGVDGRYDVDMLHKTLCLLNTNMFTCDIKYKYSNYITSCKNISHNISLESSNYYSNGVQLINNDFKIIHDSILSFVDESYKIDKMVNKINTMEANSLKKQIVILNELKNKTNKHSDIIEIDDQISQIFDILKSRIDEMDCIKDEIASSQNYIDNFKDGDDWLSNRK